MGYPLTLALKYLGSKKRASISVGTMFAVLGVALGVAALATVMSVTGGFQVQFRDKVLGVNAHVLVMKLSTEFRDYRDVMEKVSTVKGVVAAAPFSINPMMLTHGEETATGVLLKGVDPMTSLGVDAPPGVPPVLDLPRHIIEGEAGKCNVEGDLKCGIEALRGLRLADAKPAERKYEDPPEDPAFPSVVDSADPFAPPHGLQVAIDNQAKKDQQAIDERDAGTSEPSVPKLPPALPGDPSAVPGQTAAPMAGGPGAQPAAPKTSPKEKKDGARKSSDMADAGPKGSITPDGGYKSDLPDDDNLPPELTADACQDPARVKAMPGIVIGITLSQSLNLKIGDCVTVTSPTIGYQLSGGSIRPAVARTFRVLAIFEAGFDQYDSKLVYTDIYEAQRFSDQGDTVMGVEMKISNIDDTEDVIEGVKKVLMLPNGDVPYRIMDWKELNRGLFTALLIQKVGMSAVLALIILVAAFTVVATLIMVVLDKKKEIAVLKAMGATDWAILRIFLYQGGLIGFVGTSLGLLLGLCVCKGLIVYAFPLDPKVYFISHLPVLIRPFDFLFTGGVAIFLCLVATILPSLYAASVRPADGFREE